MTVRLLGWAHRLDEARHLGSVPVPITDPVAGGEHHHPGIAARPDHFQQGEPVTARQHHIQDHDIGAKLGQHMFDVAAIGTGSDMMARSGQPRFHRGTDRVGVFDHQHAGVAVARAGLPGHASRYRCHVGGSHDAPGRQSG